MFIIILKYYFFFIIFKKRENIFLFINNLYFMSSKKNLLADTIENYQLISQPGNSYGAVFNHQMEEIKNPSLFKEMNKKNTVGVQIKVLPEFCSNKKLEGGALMTILDNVTNLCLSHFHKGLLRLTVNLNILNKKDIFENETIYLISKIDGITKDYASVSCKIYNEKLEFVCRGQQIMGLIKNKVVLEAIKKDISDKKKKKLNKNK